MRILHVSDLHASVARQKDQRLLVDAFLEDIRGLHEAVPIDLVAFTGDLTHGGKAEEFALAEELFLRPLLEATGLAREQALIALGNHDVDIEGLDEIAEAGLHGVLTSRDAVNALLDDESRTRRYTERTASAQRFLAEWYADAPPGALAGLGQFHVREVQGRQVGIAALNSAWRATGAPDDGDRRRLLVGDRQTKAAVELTKEPTFNLALVHHPFDCLTTFDEDDIRRDVERHFELVLSGHTHVPDPEHIVSTRGEVVYSRTGCLYEHRDWFNGYTVLDVDDDGSVTASLRTWWPDRAAFDAATNLAPEGRLHFPRVEETTPAVVASTVDRIGYNAVLNGLTDLVCTNSVIGDHLDRLESPELDKLLVPPRLLSVPYHLAIAAGDSRPVERVDAVGALDEGDCVVVSGDAESGVSSALVWSLNRRYDVDNGRIPAFVRFRDIGAGKDPVTTAVREALRRFGQSFGPKDDLPPVVVAVDDVHLHHEKPLGRLLAHMSSHPENLYVLGCHGDPKALIDRLTAEGIRVRPAFLGPFGRRELRGLIDTIAPVRTPQLADEILGLLVREQLPRTPFLMAVFVVVLSSEGTTSTEGVNEATALERYVRLVLDRRYTSDPVVHQMDSRIYEHILASFAGRLIELNRSHMTRLDAERFLGEYFVRVGWDGSPGQVLDALIRRRVLVDDDGRVGFRHPALQRLFAAKQMLENPEFAKALLEDALRHESTIRYVAALKRSDRELLTIVGEAAERSLSAVRQVVDVRAFEQMGRTLRGWSEGLELDQIADLVTFDPVDEEERERTLDALWEQIEASDARRSATVTEAAGSEAQSVAEIEVQLLPRAVALLSEVLRHSELVEDVELKRRLALQAMEGWSHLGVLYAAYEDKTGTASELFRFFFGDADVREQERFLRVFVVLYISAMATATLGSSKMVDTLQAVLEEPTFVERTANALFATIIYAELRGKGWVDRLTRLYEDHGHHPVVSEIVVMYCRYCYLHTSTTAAEQKALEDLVVAALLDELHLSSIRAGRAKSHLLQQLRASRQEALRRSPRREPDSYLMRDLDDEPDR